MKEVLDGVEWSFGDFYYVLTLYTLTTRNIICVLLDTFKSCNLLLLSFLYKNMWLHITVMQLHTCSVILYFS
jgi:hypothetical protein